MSRSAEQSSIRHIDVLIVGAGISGICAGHYLQTLCPDMSYEILEARSAIGGTWDLFRYPGIRSDSDLYTFGFSFRPWTDERSIADGSAILKYLQDTADAEGIVEKVRFNHRVMSAEWNSNEARWTVDVEIDGRTRAVFKCRVLYACSGYYDYASGYTPDIAGLDRFEGVVVHPQDWPADLDYADKRVVVIGSGATAVTLVPAMSEKASHVTMLQRSPTYIVSLPAQDRIATFLKRHLPTKLAHALARWKNILVSMVFYQYSRRRPERMKQLIRSGIRRELGADYDIATHFTPRYDPWDQRLCLAPNGDFFKAIKSGRASVRTGTIDTVNARSVALHDGTAIDADIIVTATGLNLQILGGAILKVDGRPVESSENWLYKGAVLSGVPNFAIALGYTNASWTLKCELTSAYLCRLINQMGRSGNDWFVAQRSGDEIEMPLLDLQSGYIQRSRDLLPRQGEKVPWRLHQNYIKDRALLRWGRTDDGVMKFGRIQNEAKAA